MKLKNEAIGQRLLRLRKERGLSQRQLAEPGVTAVYICRIEKGERAPSVPVIRKLARKLGVSAEYLETGEEAPRPTLESFTFEELFQEIRKRLLEKDLPTGKNG